MLHLKSLVTALSSNSHMLVGFNIKPVMKTMPNFHTCCSPLYFQLSPFLCAEPLRKKKRIDPAVLKEKAEKKAKRLMRDIRRLEKVAKKFKPIAELEVPRSILRDSRRLRPPVELSEQEVERRAEVEKRWAVYKKEQYVAEMNTIQRIVSAQERAMDALRETSPWLYEQALQVDQDLIPFKMTGPVRTPPLEGYEYPDGEFIDVTKKYLPVVPVEEKKNKRRIGKKKKK